MTDSVNIYNQFISKFQYINIHYLNRYIKFMNLCLIKNKDFKRKIHKFDKHHILPRSLFEEHKNSEFNIVNLQYREHFIAHLLLTRMFNNKNYNMLFAFNTMNNTRNHNHSNNRIYQKEREEWSKIASIKGKERFLNVDPTKEAERNRKHRETLSKRTEEEKEKTRLKLLETLSRKSEEEKEKTRKIKSIKSKEAWNKLTKEQYKEKCIQRKENALNHYKNATKEERECRNKRNSEGQHKLSILTCPHCGKQSKSRGNMKRHHFDNCLQNPNLTEEQKEDIINKRKEISIKNSLGQLNKTLYKCPLCDKLFDIKHITKHFKQDHNINNKDDMRILKREYRKINKIT